MAWLDRRWQYRKSHVIEGSAGAGTNYQVRIRPQYDAPLKTQLELNDIAAAITTHCYPSAKYYSDTEEKTYFVYLNTDGASFDVLIKAFDHGAESWESTYTITANVGTDVHYSPSIGVLPNGKLIVFYGSHDSPQKYKVSTNVEDESAWGNEQTFAGTWTYPEVCSFGDKLVLFCRDSWPAQANRNRWQMNTTTDGAAWTGWTTVVDFGAGIRGYAMFHKVDSRILCSAHIYTVATQEFENLYFCYSADKGTTWKEEDDTAVVLPIDADQLIAVVAHPIVYTFAIVDEDDKPVVVGRKIDDNKQYWCQYSAALGNGGAWTNDFVQDAAAVDETFTQYWYPFVQNGKAVFWAGDHADGKAKKYERVAGQTHRFSVVETDDQYAYVGDKRMHPVKDGVSAANNPFEVHSSEHTCLLSHRVMARPGPDVDFEEEVILNENCRTDFADVRFTAADGITELDYWLEEKADGEYATFWVEVAADLGSDQRIYVYYGNASAASTSSGANTFPFFDDFNRADGAAVGGGWTQEDGNGANSIDTNRLKVIQHMNEYTHIEKAPTLSNMVLRGKLLAGANAGSSWMHSLAAYWDVDDWTRLGQNRDGGANELKFLGYYSKADVVTALFDVVGDADEWYYYRIRMDASLVTFDRSCDGIWWVQVTQTARAVTWAGTPNLVIVGKGHSNPPAYPNADFDNDAASAGSEGTHYGDDVFTRGYIAPEPAHGAWGREYRVPRIQGFVM